MEFNHYSVLLQETIENLNIKPDGIYVDGTLGGAGHASQVAKQLSEKGRLIGIDQDADAIQAASERLAPFGERITIIRSNYANMKTELQAVGVEHVDGIVLDLGVSSFQLDTPERGFTYREPDAPLDMGMDEREKIIDKINKQVKVLEMSGCIIDDIGIGDVVINMELFATGYIVYHEIDYWG